MRFRCLFALALAAAVFSLGGCAGGGPFFNQIESFIDREGTKGDALTQEARMYALGEKEKPGALRAGFDRYRISETEARTQGLDERKRFKYEQGQFMPEPSAMIAEAEKTRETKPRKFPAGD